MHNEIFSTRFRAEVSSDGRVLWGGCGYFKTTCKLDMTYFPYDQHPCAVKLSNWAYNTRQVHLAKKSTLVDMSYYNQNGQWTISQTTIDTKIVIYDEVRYETIEFVFLLTRKPLYYMMNFVLPCTVLAVVALLMFYIPPESGEKITIGVTVLLSFSVFQFIILDKMPETSDYVPIMSE